MDRWARWMLRDRFGGDTDAAKTRLGTLLSIRDRILDGAQLSLTDVVLDVGTGDGLVGFGALQRLDEAGRVVFSDISPDLLATCRDIAAGTGDLERCEFIEADAADLGPLSDDSVDVVTARSVLIYVADKPAAFDAFARVLAPGGRLSLFEPINRTMRRLNAGTFYGYDTRDIPELAGKVQAVFDQATPRDSPMLDFDGADLAHMAAHAGFVEVTAAIEVTLVNESWLGPATWQMLLNARPNPNAPTVGDALDQALTVDEQQIFAENLRPQVEAGHAEWFNVGCYLTAIRPT